VQLGEGEQKPGGEMPRKLTAVPEPEPLTTAPDLRTSVASALADMTWLKPSDEGIRAIALNIAEQIETARDRADELDALWRETGGDQGVIKRLQKLEAMCDLTKTLGWLGPQLQGVLRDLGGTPQARAAMKQDQPIGGRLAQLRAGTPGKNPTPPVDPTAG
jgi:hypothetical protein